MRYPFRGRTRSAFTLIELLVVIAILAILMSLVTAGVIKYLQYIPQTQTVNDIRQLSVGIENFKTKYGVYPPSSIFLSNNPNDYPPGSPSLAYLYAIWPRLKFADAGGNPQIDWSGQGKPVGGLPAGVTLEGDQCLVFFLNGPGGANANGWSTNPTNPTQVSGPRVGPFFEFPLNRLAAYNRSSQPPTVSAMFPSFYDSYANIDKVTASNLKGLIPTTDGLPYAFFCSGRSAGGYGPHCPSLNVLPYMQTNVRFYNNNSFQIISAGKNLAFGPGGAWPPGNPASAYNPGGSGVDDLSNFWGDLLGVF
jgi:prepilin-type N-terminal cleavage/methylation domain-containing protein